MKILFQGDSITDGNRYKDKNLEWDKNHQIGHSYAYITTGLLSLKYFDKGYEFINRGISGNKTIDLLARWQEDCIDINPDILIVLVGVNDVFFSDDIGGFNKKNFEENYSQLLLQIRQKNPNVEIILLEPFCYIDSPLAKARGATKFDIKFAQKTVKTLSKRFHAKFIALQEDFNIRIKKTSFEYWLWDGIHPTEAGHALIAEKLIIILEEIL